MSFIPSTEFKAESPFVLTCTLDELNVVINYNNGLVFTLFADRDETGRVVGLGYYTLTLEGKDYLPDVNDDYVIELIELALQGYLYWERNRLATHENTFEYRLVEMAREFFFEAARIFNKALV